MTLEAPTCRRAARLLVTLALALGLAPACSVLPVGWSGRQGGLASWYGPGFYGKRTASGTVYTGTALTAAHPSLPFCTPGADDQPRERAHGGGGAGGDRRPRPVRPRRGDRPLGSGSPAARDDPRR